MLNECAFYSYNQAQVTKHIDSFLKLITYSIFHFAQSWNTVLHCPHPEGGNVPELFEPRNEFTEIGKLCWCVVCLRICLHLFFLH